MTFPVSFSPICLRPIKVTGRGKLAGRSRSVLSVPILRLVLTGTAQAIRVNRPYPDLIAAFDTFDAQNKESEPLLYDPTRAQP